MWPRRLSNQGTCSCQPKLIPLPAEWRKERDVRKTHQAVLVETYLCKGPALFHRSLVLSICCFSSFLHNSKPRYQR